MISLNLRILLVVLAFSGFGLISFIPEFLSVKSTLITIPFRMLIAALSSLILLSYIFQKENLQTFKKISILIILLLFFYSYRLISDLYISNLDFGRSSGDIMLIAFLVSFYTAFALYFASSNKILLKVINPILGISTIVCLLSLFSGATYYYEISRLAGNATLNPISLGHIATTGLILILVKYKFSGISSRLSLYAHAIASLVFVYTLFAAASRGPIASLLLALGFFFYPRFNFSFKNIFFLIFFLGLGVIFFQIFIADLDLRRLAIDLGDGEEGTGETRVILWITGIQMFLESPLLGKHTTTIYGYPHNIFIEILMSMGIVGGIIFLYTLFLVYKRMQMLNFSNSPLVWVPMVFIQHLFGAFVSGTIYSSDLLWYSLALILSIDYLKINEQSENLVINK